MTIDKVDFAMMEQTFAVNTLGPLRVTQVLVPNLLASKHRPRPQRSIATAVPSRV